MSEVKVAPKFDPSKARPVEVHMATPVQIGAKLVKKIALGRDGKGADSLASEMQMHATGVLVKIPLPKDGQDVPRWVLVPFANIGGVVLEE